MKPGWTLEWYIEHQFGDEVKRQHKSDWKDAIRRPEVQLACDLAAIRPGVRR